MTAHRFDFPTNKIAQTPVSVSQISFGCSALANMYRTVTAADAQSLLTYSWNSGIRYFDTAPHYGRGLSEARLGEFLRTVPRDAITLSTKVGRVLRPGAVRAEADGFLNPLPNDVHYDYSGAGILESFNGSCARLGTDYIDILYVHDIGRATHGADNQKHFQDLMETGLPMLANLKQQGRIGAYGLGVNECEVCIDVLQDHPLDVILLAGRWTLLDRTAEQTLVPLCKSLGVSLVLGGIFNSGILATGAVPGAHFDYAPASQDILQRTRALEAESAAQNISLATAALRFAVAQDCVASVLIGTGKVSSLARNLESL
ncbi:aldo/keto reductase [Cognatishimia sp. WU-CL00825]|uniref:aldo/keto reductase n=1 Tax=Cognatishimia sp. WU-CL00825 TaxID=3127658 RepID=UPI003108FC3D